uniref:Lipoprotein SmpA/OmlA domain-containing protein n=1 Tax=Pakpunavirus sp. TaxID=2833053 RepID=A0AB39BYG4_9CAUD
MKGILLSALLIIFLAGCVSGQRFTQQQVDQIKVGVTTEKDLLNIFGAPMAFNAQSDGSKTLVWTWSYASLGGVRSGSKMLSVTLGPDGKAKDYGVSSYASPGFR